MSVGATLFGLAAIGTGVAGIVAADAAPGDGFGPVDITASASGVRAPLYSTGGEDVAGQVPWATTSMRTGGVSRALTSVFWPGDTGGHGGDTLSLLGVPCIVPNPSGVLPVDPPCVYQPPAPPPSVYDSLNDPYKAEAQSGRKTLDSRDDNGVAMTAKATQTDALATTTLSGSKVPGVGDQFGKTTTTTHITFRGAHTAVVDSTSVVHDVSLGGGAVTIAAITSVAHAVSDTVKAVGTAATTVSGMKIAGVPVTVDDKGLHVAGQGSTLPGSDQLNQALAQSGFQIFVAKPSKVVHGAAITLDSGNLVLMQNNSQYVHQANDTARLLILGGANIQANTGKGFSFGALPLPPPAVPATTTGAGAGTPGTPGTPGIPGTPGSATGVSPQLAGQAPLLAANRAPLGHTGVSVGWTVALLLGAGALAFGLRRLPDEVLATRGTSCPLGETTS